MRLYHSTVTLWAGAEIQLSYRNIHNHDHRVDTKVVADYFSLFTFHKIINIWK